MTAKEYLEQAFYLDQRIESDLKEVAELKAMATRISSPGFEERHNPNHATEAPFVKQLEKVWALERQIDAEVDRLVDLKAEIRSIISEVRDPGQQLLLRHRYIHFRSWDEVEDELGVQRRWAQTLHSRAIRSVEAILDKRGIPHDADPHDSK